MREPAIHEPKAELRRRMREALRATLPDERARWSFKIVEHIIQAKSWPAAEGAVAIFGGVSSEPDLLPLLSWLLAQGRTAVLFGVEGDIMTPYRVRGAADLVKGPIGVLEPIRSPDAKIRIADLGTVFVPGLAFGRANGGRLGRGRGHYDRVLGHPEFRGEPVGVAFELQHLDAVPLEVHDVPMARLLGELGWTEIGST